MAEVAIVGLGFVGGAMFKSFTEKGVNVYGYDKYKDGGIGTFNQILETDILFLCLPTPFCRMKKTYDKQSIYETCELLVNKRYNGIVVIKSTVEPGTTSELFKRYKLNLIHYPCYLLLRQINNQQNIL